MPAELCWVPGQEVCIFAYLAALWLQNGWGQGTRCQESRGGTGPAEGSHRVPARQLEEEQRAR